MWEKGVSLTSDGCALTYLVDNAGSRTTSDAVNKDYMTDYALKVFTDCSVWGAHLQHDAEKACSSYKFSTLKDGVHMFEILGYRIQQTTDGMVQWVKHDTTRKMLELTLIWVSSFVCAEFHVPTISWGSTRVHRTARRASARLTCTRQRRWDAVHTCLCDIMSVVCISVRRRRLYAIRDIRRASMRTIIFAFTRERKCCIRKKRHSEHSMRKKFFPRQSVWNDAFLIFIQ